jgi:hypothetical protein
LFRHLRDLSDTAQMVSRLLRRVYILASHRG